MKVYLAHPVRGDEDWHQIISDICWSVSTNIEIMDPFAYTPKAEDDPEQRKVFSKLILDVNVRLIERANLIIAVIDNRDMGVVWEMGYAHAMRTDIITVSAHDYDNNIMLQSSVLAHVKNIHENARVLRAIINTVIGSRS